jgi:hypothetical protein
MGRSASLRKADEAECAGEEQSQSGWLGRGGGCGLRGDGEGVEDGG